MSKSKWSGFPLTYGADVFATIRKILICKIVNIKKVLILKDNKNRYIKR